jgi:hypothetical protein
MSLTTGGGITAPPTPRGISQPDQDLQLHK